MVPGVNSEGFQPEPIEGAEVLQNAAEQLRGLVELLGFQETEQMAQSRADIVLAAAGGDYPFDLATEYHLLAETMLAEEDDKSGCVGENKMIALMLQVALMLLEAGQIEYSIEDLGSAIDYTDNRRHEVPELEELGDEIHTIRKMLGWKKE